MAFKDKQAAYEYVSKYNADNYDRITIMLPKGYRERLKAVSGGSVTAYLKSLIDMELQKEGQA